MSDAVLIAAADALAERVHAGQTDRAGVPYIQHLRRVAETVEPQDATHVIVALLHDSVEDTTEDRLALRRQISDTFGSVVGGAVDAMTHRIREPYRDYIERVGMNPVARAVKIADLRHNLDASRLGRHIHPNRVQYEAALTRLEAVHDSASG